MKMRECGLAVMLALCLWWAAGCTTSPGGSTGSPASPIDAAWTPAYIDNQTGPSLSSADLVSRVSPTVVSIIFQTVGRGAFLQPVPQTGAASGVLIDPKGYIVTNSHVVEGARSLQVTLSDGRIFDAVQWASDKSTDLAVVQIRADGALPCARFLSDSMDKLGLVEQVVAVGNALALPGGPTWTEGVVSYLGRSIQESNGVVLDDLIQTDTAINPGNSGGPLVNQAGQVVGINTVVASGAENIGFCISTDTVIPVVYSLITRGYDSSGFLGVSTLTVNPVVQSQYGLSVDSGALIVQLAAGGPAEAAGLQTDDVITGLDGAPIPGSHLLSEALRRHSAGDTVAVTYVRGQAAQSASVTLGRRPSS